MYRSGALNLLSDEGKALLSDKLGIKKVFDLRSVMEHQGGPDPEIDGVENIWTPSTASSTPSSISRTSSRARARRATRPCT